MKLCRFELKSNPGEARSGIVYGAKIYETDGVNPIATHEAEAVRPLSPIGVPPSIRFFELSQVPVETLLGEEKPTPLYSYGNPSAVVGPSTIVPLPGFTNAVDFQTYVVAVLAQPGTAIPVDEADDYVLGVTLCTILVARDVEREERRAGLGFGRSRDFAIAVGPVLTTPEELDEVISDASAGKRFKLRATVKLNGVEIRSGDLEELSYTLAEAISAASESSILRAGDLIAVGPVAPSMDESRLLEGGDEIQFAVERLGTLSLKIAL